MLNVIPQTLARKRGQDGFTLIELMLIVAIVAVLVMLAVPTYQEYSVRAKVAECLNSAGVAKLQISEYRLTMLAWPPDPDAAGVSDTGISTFCSGFVAYDAFDGSFQVDIDEIAVGNFGLGIIQPELIPTLNTSTIDWNCSRGATAGREVRYLPSTCRDAS